VLCSIALVGGGAALMSSPASAQATINWKHIWKTQIKPRADKRYYTKIVADGRYARAGSSYTKAESDGKYAAAGSSYSKAESDAKYLAKPTVLRGTWTVWESTPAGSEGADSISFGQTLASAPTVHYIAKGALVPTGCSGSPAAPGAAPGNLCVFEQFNNGAGGGQVLDPTTQNLGQSAPFGAAVVFTSPTQAAIFVYGSWALGVGSLAPNSAVSQAPHVALGKPSPRTGVRVPR
jgi:hypothetical protein